MTGAYFARLVTVYVLSLKVSMPGGLTVYSARLWIFTAFSPLSLTATDKTVPLQEMFDKYRL